MTFANISLVGRLVRQPELTVFNSGREKSTFTVAINHPGRKMSDGARTEGTVDFIKVEAWGKLAEIAHKYLVKGSQVTVCGPFQMDVWVDKQGVKRMTPLVEAQHIALPPRLAVVDQPVPPKPSTITGELEFSGEPEDPGEEGEEFIAELQPIDQSDEEMLELQPTLASLTG